MERSQVYIFGLILGVAAFAAYYFVLGKGTAAAYNSGPVSIASTWPDDKKAQQDEFWRLIEATRSAADPASQSAKLETELQKLSTSDLEKFIRIFDVLMYDSYSWDLWGAAYVINGGASDDGFEDFRKWLISNGRNFFETAKSDPENLAKMIPVGRAEEANFEEFSYVAMDVWVARTGKNFSELPKDKSSLYPPEPFGEPFSEDAKDLEKRYPLLWARFGGNPLSD